MNERDIIGEPDARLIADETDAARAEVVAPPGWIVVTHSDGAASLVCVRDIHGALTRTEGHVVQTRLKQKGTKSGRLEWYVRETPAEVCALIAAAQGEPQRDGGADIAREMAEALRLVDKRWTEHLGSPDDAVGSVCDVWRSIRSALTRYGQRGAR